MVSALSQLISRARQGDSEAHERVVALVYDELRAIARAKLARNAADSLQPTELVNAMYERLAKNGKLIWENRRHLFFVAARAMQDILVERARHNAARKRNRTTKPIALSSASQAAEEQPEELLMLNDAISRLNETDKLSAEIVRLRYFAGLTGDETANALGVSPSTVDRRWQYAKAWLHSELSG